MTSEDAAKVLGLAGFKIRRLTRRMYAVERECSQIQLVKIAKVLGNVSRVTDDAQAQV